MVIVSAEYGALAASLAKAQASFPAINRDKKVTVQTKAGGSYTFNYAPLDTILAAVRKPLSDNGLAIIQLLDEDVLVTSLLHESGAILSGRTPIPASEGIQAYGSAITYLRRYAIQALLGIAAEEDDDGNQSQGNTAVFSQRRPPPPRLAPRPGIPIPLAGDGLIGVAEVGKTGTADFELRETPDGHALSFRLVDGRKGIKVVAFDPIASALALVREDVLGKRVTVWGKVTDESFVKDGKTIAWQQLVLERIQAPDITLPAVGPDPESGLTSEDEAELDAIAI